MKNALLVDDDYLARSYLKMLPSWERAGFCVKADAKNGTEALGLINKGDIDLVITDIVMPVMDGIQLIREIRRNNKYIYLIGISSQDNMEYVKKAMQGGADEYVLKDALSEESLYGLLATAKDRLRERAEEKKKTGIVPRETGQGSRNQAQAFFSRILAGELDKGHYEEEKIRAGIHGQYQNSAVVVMKLEDGETSEDLWAEVKAEQYCQEFSKKLSQELDRLLSGREAGWDVIYLGNGVFCCFIDLSGIYKSSLMQQKLTGVASACYQVCQGEGHFYKIGVSNVCIGPESLRQAYGQARIMVKLCFYEQGGIAYYEAGKCLGSSLPKEADKLVKQMDSLKYSNGNEKFLAMCKDALTAFKKERTESRLVVQWLHQLQQTIGMEKEEYIKIRNLEDVSGVLAKIGDTLLEHVDIQIAEHVSSPVRIAAEYATAHYKEAIGLNDAASAAGVNSTYLSYLFSREMGMGFANYILWLRMEYAKKLLEESSLRMRAIAEKAGFRDYHYFSKVFKKKNGVSPAEYRNAHGK